MRILCLIFVVISVAYKVKAQCTDTQIKWKSNKVVPGTKYEYDNKTMDRIRFKTSDWHWSWRFLELRFYNPGQYNGKYSSEALYINDIRGRWFVNMLHCMPRSVPFSERELSNVPKDRYKIWTLCWDDESLYLQCNGKNLWSYKFPDRRCWEVFNDLSYFSFTRSHSYHILPDTYYTREITDQSE